MKVTCEVQESTEENDDGYEVPCVVVTCSRCKHTTRSFGTSDASVRRCCVLMREECPRDEDNFYSAGYK